jgi:hypothetical protein
MPSTPTILGLLVGIAAIVIAFVTGVPDVMGVVLIVAVVGWVTFAARDLVRAIRDRRAA